MTPKQRRLEKAVANISKGDNVIYKQHVLDAVNASANALIEESDYNSNRKCYITPNEKWEYAKGVKALQRTIKAALGGKVKL